MKHFVMHYPGSLGERLASALSLPVNRVPRELVGGLVWVIGGEVGDLRLLGALLVERVEERDDDDAGYLFSLVGSIGARFSPAVRPGRGRWFGEMVESLARFRPELQELFERPYVEGLCKRALDHFEQADDLDDPAQDLRRSLVIALGGDYTPAKRAPKEASTKEGPAPAPTEEKARPPREKTAPRERAPRPAAPEAPPPPPRFVALPSGPPEPVRWLWIYRGGANTAEEISLEAWLCDPLTQAGELALLLHAGRGEFVGLARAAESARVNGRQVSCEGELLASFAPLALESVASVLSSWSVAQQGFSRAAARIPGEVWAAIVQAEEARDGGGSLGRIERQLSFDLGFAEMARDTAERHPRLLESTKRRAGVVCVACGFDFGRVYGPRAAGLIELHALRSREERGRVLPVAEELVPLCANCHRVVHAGPVPLSLDALRALLAPR